MMSKPMNTCCVCHKKININAFLNCNQCKRTYDLRCASVSEKHFTLMSIDQKSKWKCSLHASKQQKTDFKDTSLLQEARTKTPSPSSPLSPSSDKGSSPTDSGSNITLRVKTATCHVLNEEVSTLPHNPLTKDEVRHIFREEFDLMRSSLIGELNDSLKKLVRTEFQTLKTEMATLENSVKFLDANYETIKSSISSYEGSFIQIQKENLNLINTVQDLTSRLQIMEQVNRSNNLEVQCVPEHKQENLITTVMQLSKVVACDLKESDIHLCTRVAKSNKEDSRPRAIIVKLATPRLRDTFLACTIKYNKAHPSDKLNTSLIGIGGNKTPIYVAEHLSPINKKLHAAARHAAKEKGYKFVWIKQGKVFVRKTESSEYVFVRNQETLDNLQ